MSVGFNVLVERHEVRISLGGNLGACLIMMADPSYLKYL